jgi:hypothetical protein
MDWQAPDMFEAVKHGNKPFSARVPALVVTRGKNYRRTGYAAVLHMPSREMKTRSLRSLAAFAGLFAILALAFASQTHAEERERLRVSTLFIGSSLMPFWLAQQGIFARHGIDVELI